MVRFLPPTHCPVGLNILQTVLALEGFLLVSEVIALDSRIAHRRPRYLSPKAQVSRYLSP